MTTGSHRREGLLMTIPQVADELGIGRSSVYELIKSEELTTIHIGRSVRIPRAALEEWLRKRLAEDH